MPSADRQSSARTPRTQGNLFEKPAKLLTIGQAETLFCDALGIHRATFFESHRPWLPFVYTRVRKVRGCPGEYRRGSPRLRASVARELLELAINGRWAEYAMGNLVDELPHLYPESLRRAA